MISFGLLPESFWVIHGAAVVVAVAAAVFAAVGAVREGGPEGANPFLTALTSTKFMRRAGAAGLVGLLIMAFAPIGYMMRSQLRDQITMLRTEKQSLQNAHVQALNDLSREHKLEVDSLREEKEAELERCHENQLSAQSGEQNWQTQYFQAQAQIKTLEAQVKSLEDQIEDMEEDQEEKQEEWDEEREEMQEKLDQCQSPSPFGLR